MAKISANWCWKFQKPEVASIFCGIKRGVIPSQAPVATADIAENLSAAWLFLSGEARHFALSLEPVPPPYRACSSVLNMALPKLAMRFQVCVLLDLPDAQKVTRHMFGCDDEPLDTRDVLDASAEVCNILAVAISANLTGFETAGVPSMMDATDYAELCRSNGLREIYSGAKSQDGSGSIINVLVTLPKIGL
jgi:hypothetical protein